MKRDLVNPRCPECSTVLAYDLAHNRWACPTHGPAWSGEALALVRGFSEDF